MQMTQTTHCIYIYVVYTRSQRMNICIYTNIYIHMLGLVAHDTQHLMYICNVYIYVHVYIYVYIYIHDHIIGLNENDAFLIHLPCVYTHNV